MVVFGRAGKLLSNFFCLKITSLDTNAPTDPHKVHREHGGSDLPFFYTVVPSQHNQKAVVASVSGKQAPGGGDGRLRVASDTACAI